MILTKSYKNKEIHYDDKIITSDGHEIYFEVKGNSSSTPVVFLHGGPGARVVPAHFDFFNPKLFFSILFDQRGCGKSKPFCELKNNNIQNLILDMERLREKLGLQKWILFGGSWGSTLALYYAINYPERCLGLVLRGVFLGTRNEIDWFLCGMRKFYPEAHKLLLKGLNFSELEQPTSDEILKRGSELIFSKNEEVSQKAANAWAKYEMSCSTLDYREREMSGSSALSLAKIELHYFLNNCFLKDNEILDNVKKIRNIPIYIIQGRHDTICPPFTALKLRNKLTNSKLIMVENAGHSAFETGIKNALIKSISEIL
tara:strand:- start:4183 stop:5127 length:945 start_codon:yes stop_codon:yes gene_type:complete